MEVSCPKCGQSVKAGDPDEPLFCPRCSTGFSVRDSAVKEGRPALGSSSFGPPITGRANEADATEKRMIPGYDILEPIGSGGMGVVYRARQTSLDRVVAMKVMRGTQFTDPDLRTRFVREVKTAGGLQHPGIVPVYDAGESEGTLFYTMELVDGESIKDYVLKRDLTRREIARLILQVADALAYAHDMGVVHRDLKPGNIIVDTRGRARILDFGLAKWSKSGEVASSVTVTGMPMGTPGYMSPEQSMGRWQEVDARTDVFALGVMSYELLSGGKHPFSVDFKEDGAYAVIRKINEQKARRLAAVNAEVDPVLSSVIDTALSKKLDKRYASGEAFAAALRQYMTEFDSVALAKLSRRRGLKLFVLPLVVGMLLFSGFVVGHNLLWHRRLSAAIHAGEDVKAEALLSNAPPVAATLGLDAEFTRRYVAGWLKRNRAILRDRENRDWQSLIAAILGTGQLGIVRENAARELLLEAFVTAGQAPSDLSYPIMKRLRGAAGPEGAALFGNQDVVAGLTPEDARAWREKQAAELGFPTDRAIEAGTTRMQTTLIPSGVALLGALPDDADATDDELPLEWRVVSRPFYIGKTEVTAGQFAEVMGRPLPASEQARRLPAFGVSFAEAEEFCKRLSQLSGASVRLPTEVEWEYVCRAGSISRFYFGEAQAGRVVEEYEWIRPNAGRRPHAVAQKRPNPWGVHDMGGNVTEWCADEYAPADHAAVGGPADQKPDSKEKGDRHVLRGGSWQSSLRACRSAARRSAPSSDRWPTRGFRVAVDVK